MNKRGKKFLKIAVGLAVLIIFLALLNLFVSPINNFFYFLSSPIQKVFWSAGQYFNSGSLAQENQNLKTQNQLLLSQVVALQSVIQAQENQNSAIALCQDRNFKFIMAEVVGLDSSDILSISKGSADGVAEDMPVINQQNVLFGKVLKVYQNYSKVVLISAKDSVVNVETQSDSHASGIVKGQGGLTAYLDLIPTDKTINSQDVLITSSVDSFYPKDLLVARIDQVEKDDQKPFQQAKITLFSDIKTADNLFVITSYKR